MFIFVPPPSAQMTDKAWKVRELTDRTMDFRPPTQFERFIDGLPEEG